MTQELKQMPTCIIDEKEKAQYLGELRHSITTMQNSVKALAAMSDFIAPCSADAADWLDSLAAADKRRDEALKAIEGNIILTSDGKGKAVKEWRQWHRVIATHINAVIKSINAWPQAAWKWDELVNNIVPGADLIQVAAEYAKRDVPPMAQEHAKLIDEVRKALIALRDWEEEKDVCRIPLLQLLWFNAEALATRWADGSIIENHRFEKWAGITASFKKGLII